MKKFKPNETTSADILAENIEMLKSLFPEAWTEGKIDFEVLKQLLGGVLDEREEKYGLNWHGKRRARQLALTPSIGTLRPCPEESVDWETTRNLMIEGDNLEVLKLLQKSYAGKVKLIYIDPPYNTGNDFVYPDDFRDSIENYQKLMGWRTEDGERISSLASGKNSESSGRFHTDWLNMMYPRLKLSRQLLRHDGLIFISIDDGELPALRLAANDIFGEENFLACFIWKSRQNKDNRTVTGASVDHEYIVCYGNSIRGSDRDVSQYSNPDDDPRGDWASANMVGIATIDRRPNLHYDLVNPKTGINYGCPNMGWRYDRKTMGRLISEKRILWPTDPNGRPRRKSFFKELESDFTGFSTVIGDDIYTKDGTADVDNLFENRVFNFPKPVRLISSIVEQGSQHEIVLDFFSGSGTTGHATITQNTIDGGKRRYILVQLPEPLNPENRDQKTAAGFCDQLGKPRNIAELTKERLRRAGKKIREEHPDFKGDLGFRVFKLDTTNIHAWEPDRKDLSKSLFDSVEHLKSDRTEQDILYELLLKLGLDLCVPIEQKKIDPQMTQINADMGLNGNDLRTSASSADQSSAEHTVYSIGGGVLMVCLSMRITREDVEPLSLKIMEWHKQLAPAGEITLVFRDSAFVDDVAKTNLTAILQQHGLGNVRSL